VDDVVNPIGEDINQRLTDEAKCASAAVQVLA
jgi:hypothetical protein